MAEEKVEFFSDYQAGNEDLAPAETLTDSEREFPLEARCCMTGEVVKHSFCRYPDPEEETMMIMSRESMLKYSRNGFNLSETFAKVLEMRRSREKK
jgi:hypothetical protein